jgi:hypothetical protein
MIKPIAAVSMADPKLKMRLLNAANLLLIAFVKLYFLSTC